jgi:hypothetical protein
VAQELEVFRSDGDKGTRRVLALQGVKVDALRRASTIMMGTTESSILGLVPNMAWLTFPGPDEIFIFPGAGLPSFLETLA